MAAMYDSDGNYIGDDGTGIGFTFDDPTGGGLGNGIDFGGGNDPNAYLNNPNYANGPGGADGTGGQLGQNGYNIGGANGGVTIGSSGAGSGDTDNSATIGAPSLNVSPQPVTTTFGAGIPGLSTLGAARGSPNSTGTNNIGQPVPANRNDTVSGNPGDTLTNQPGSALNPVTNQGNPGAGGAGGAGGGSGLNTGNLFNAANFAALMAAIKSNSDSADLKTLGQQASQTANPFGQYRQQYGDQLSALEKDPSSIVDTPGYKFNLSQGLGAVSAQDASRTGGGAGGGADKDRMDYASGLASKTYNDTISQLSNLAGSQFNPSTAGQIQLAGGVASLNASDSALGALGKALGNTAGSGGLTLPSLGTATAGDIAHYASGTPQDTGGPIDSSSSRISTDPTSTEDLSNYNALNRGG